MKAFIRTGAPGVAFLLRDRRAATAVEYGLILAVIVLAIMAALYELAGSTTSMWNTVASKVATAR